MHNNMDTFIIRAYTKKELAQMYFPTASTPHAAVNHLMEWIKRCSKLYESLVGIGYMKNAKFFTPREVSLIVEYLGEPVKIYE